MVLAQWLARTGANVMVMNATHEYFGMAAWGTIPARCFPATAQGQQQAADVAGEIADRKQEAQGPVILAINTGGGPSKRSKQ